MFKIENSLKSVVFKLLVFVGEGDVHDAHEFFGNYFTVC